MLTILKTSQEGGLQVQIDGRWRDVDPPTDGFIVNLGLRLSCVIVVSITYVAVHFEWRTVSAHVPGHAVFMQAMHCTKILLSLANL